MKKDKSPKICLGDLIETLYQEAAKVERDKEAQDALVYLALIDLQQRKALRFPGLQSKRKAAPKAA